MTEGEKMIEKFIEENFERDVKSFVSARQIHNSYLKFAVENNLEEISQSALTKRLNTKMIGAARNKTIDGELLPVRYGLRLK